MVTLQKNNDKDRFVDWLFGLTDAVRRETGLPEKQCSQAVAVMVEKIQSDYGGKRPYVHQPQKKEAILIRWRSGWPINKIASDVDCTQDWVRKVLSSELG